MVVCPKGKMVSDPVWPFDEREEFAWLRGINKSTESEELPLPGMGSSMTGT